MANDILALFRRHYPQAKDVSDAELSLLVAKHYPQTVERDPGFARNVEAFRQMRLNDADTAARTSLAGHVGAAVESGMENFVGAVQAVDRELIAPLTGGTVDQWASAVPEAASLMLRQPVREAGKVFTAAGDVLANEVGALTRLTTLDPAGPVAQGLQDVGRSVPVLAASMGLQRLGVNPAVAFGAPPAVQTYGETGDVAATLKAGAAGALIPAVAQVGKLGGAALNRALIERNLLSPAANATQKAVEVLGSQGAVQVFMEGLRLPEYAALDPEARREAIYRNLVANTAFLAMDLPTFKRSVPSETLLRMAPAERVAYGLRDAANNPELVDALQRTADELARQATLPDAAQVEGEGPLFRREAPLGEVPGPRQNTQAPPDSASTVAQRFPGPAADAPGRPLDPFPTDQGAGETVEAGGETAIDQMLRDRRQNKFREKAEAIRARRDAWINQTLEQAGERGSLEYVSTTRPDRTVIVSPVPGQPGRWRTTQFDSAGPMGHYEFDSREQAIRAVGGEHHTKQIAGPGYFGTGEYVLKRSKERYNIAADSRPLDPFPTDQGAGETVAPDAEWNVVGMGRKAEPPKGGIPELPPILAEAIAAENRPDVYVEHAVSMFGESARGDAESIKPTPGQRQLLEQGRAIAQKNGWDWNAVQEAARKQLGLDQNFLKPDSRPAQVWDALQKRKAEIAKRIQLSEEQAAGAAKADQQEATKGTEGTTETVTKQQAAVKASRFRPRDAVEFAGNIVGPSGTKLKSYVWSYKLEEFVDKAGEERVRRVSDWDKADQSAATGRDLVHKFLVELPSGEQKLVSAEGVLKELGYISPEQKKFVGDLANTAKTLARLKMAYAAGLEADTAHAQLVAEVKRMPLPPVEGPLQAGQSPLVNESVRWRMGDADVRQFPPGPITEERRQTLINAWQNNRIKELGGNPFYRSGLADIEQKIAKAEAKLKQAAKQAAGAAKAEPAEGAPVSAGTGSSTPTPEATPQPVPRKPRQFRPRETVGDILDDIEAAGGLISKSEARNRKLLSAEKNGPEYDDAPSGLAHPAHNFIYGNGRGGKGSNTPDRLLKSLASQNPKYADMTVPDLWAAIKQASAGRVGNARIAVRERKQAAEMAREEVKAQKDFNRAIQKQDGDAEVAVDELAVGQEMVIAGERFKVESIDPDTGDVVLKDGPRFGRRVVESGKVIYVEQMQATDASTDFLSPEEQRPTVAPKGPRLGAGQNQGDLIASTQSEDFALVGERGTDNERLAAAKAKAEQDAVEAKALQDKQQGDMFGGTAGSPRQPQGTFGLPAIPAGTATAVPSKRMVVTMERLVPGFTTVANIEGRLSAIVNVARGIADASPIRSNRLSRRFAGVYTTPSRVVRMWDRLNLPTTAHEVAHALADAIFGTAASRGLRGIPPAVGRELVRLGRNLYGNTRPNAGYAAEGWAELVADYLTTDDIARRAPEATRWLENTVLPAFPEVAQAMREARAEIDVWRGMGARERMRAQTAPHDSKLARLRTELGRYVGREGLVEQFAPFEALSRRFRQVAGRDLAADEDPFLIASARRGQAGRGVEHMRGETGRNAHEGRLDRSRTGVNRGRGW